jgi:hypothetical protein
MEEKEIGKEKSQINYKLYFKTIEKQKWKYIVKFSLNWVVWSPLIRKQKSIIDYSTIRCHH